VSGASVQVSDSGCSNCSAVSISVRESNGANSYGGAMSVLYVGAYSWSRSVEVSSSSKCEATSVSGVSVQVSDSCFSNCSAGSISGILSYGANLYGGAMSALYVGAYSWSLSNTASSSSKCEATNVSEVSVQVSDSGCSNCRALSRSVKSYGANLYGGAMSALYVGAYSWSLGDTASSSSRCEATNVSEVSVQVSDSGCSNCSAVSISDRTSFGANLYGGAMSALYVGAYSYSTSYGASMTSCTASVTNTHAHLLSITIKRSSFQSSTALSSECYLLILNAKDLTRFEISASGLSIQARASGLRSQAGLSYGANVSSSAAALHFFACDPASWWLFFTLRRFTAAQSASWSGLMFGRLWELEALPLHAAPSSATSAVFLSMARQYKTASQCPSPPVLSLRHLCSRV
jgi:uncharacterized protein (DUF697 family)